jgi:adenylate cyclase
MTEVVDYGVLNEDTVRSLLRAISHTAERLAWWQFETLVDDAARRLELDHTSARIVVIDRIADLADILEEQMTYAWRRNLSRVITLIGKRLEHSRDGADAGELPLVRAVGFADLVGYTEASQHMDAGELAALVQEFGSTTAEIVSRGGGRVVKTIGDAMMFVADDAALAARITLDLAESIGLGGLTPPARVSMVWGRVLAQFGDVFGPSVNLASRLAGMAGPGEVVVDHKTALALADVEGLDLVARPATQAAGIGLVNPYQLVRQG